MVHWNNSYCFGKSQEVRILPVIKEYFKKDINPTQGQYAKYDFYDDETNYELKSRTNHYNRYPDTMITQNKICGCDTKDLILLFNFTDGLYFIKFDTERFANYFRNDFSRAGRDDDMKLHIYIPIADLTLIQSWNVLPFPALSKSGGF